MSRALVCEGRFRSGAGFETAIFELQSDLEAPPTRQSPEKPCLSCVAGTSMSVADTPGPQSDC
jgi:hypothetical protein